MSKEYAWDRSKYRAKIRRGLKGYPKSARTKLSAAECWRIVEALGGETPEHYRIHQRGEPNEKDAREWIAEQLRFDYDPEGRIRPFNNGELQKIRDALFEKVEMEGSDS